MLGSNLRAITYFSIITILFLSGCKKPDNTDRDVRRFEDDLVACLSGNSKQSLDDLKANYPEFLPIFTEYIIGIGKTDDPNLEQLLNQFVGDPVIEDISIKVKDLYDDFNQYAGQISNSITKFQQEVNAEASISIVTYISGFNQSC